MKESIPSSGHAARISLRESATYRPAGPFAGLAGRFLRLPGSATGTTLKEPICPSCPLDHFGMLFWCRMGQPSPCGVGGAIKRPFDQQELQTRTQGVATFPKDVLHPTMPAEVGIGRAMSQQLNCTI
jgi:hypothetical protein